MALSTGTVPKLEHPRKDEMTADQVRWCRQAIKARHSKLCAEIRKQIQTGDHPSLVEACAENLRDDFGQCIQFHELYRSYQTSASDIAKCEEWKAAFLMDHFDIETKIESYIASRSEAYPRLSKTTASRSSKAEARQYLVDIPHQLEMVHKQIDLDLNAMKKQIELERSTVVNLTGELTKMLKQQAALEIQHKDQIRRIFDTKKKRFVTNQNQPFDEAIKKIEVSSDEIDNQPDENWCSVAPDSSASSLNPPSCEQSTTENTATCPSSNLDVASTFNADSSIQLEKPNQLHQVTEPQVSPQSAEAPEPQVAARLPRFKLEKFDGDPKKFKFFMQSFMTLVHNATSDDSVRLLTLRELLSRSVRARIADSLYDPVHYQTALTRLNEEYGNACAITLAHLDTLVNLPFFEDGDPESLINFASQVHEAVIVLSSTGREVELKSSWVMKQIVLKLPYNMKMHWAERIRINGGDLDILELDRWLQEQSQNAYFIRAIEGDSRKKEPIQVKIDFPSSGIYAKRRSSRKKDSAQENGDPINFESTNPDEENGSLFSVWIPRFSFLTSLYPAFRHRFNFDGIRNFFVDKPSHSDVSLSITLHHTNSKSPNHPAIYGEFMVTSRDR